MAGINGVSPDIELLFGVLGGASLSGQSGVLIHKQLSKIMGELNKNPIGVRIGILKDKAQQDSLRGALQAELNAIQGDKSFAIEIPHIRIGAGAKEDFRRQLGAMIGALNLEKGTTVVIKTDGTEVAAKQIRDVGQASEESKRKAAELAVQLAELGRARQAANTIISALEKGASTEAERSAVAQLREQYNAFATNVEYVKRLRGEEQREAIAGYKQQGEALLALARAAKEQAKTESAGKKDTMASLRQILTLYKQVNSYIEKNPRIIHTDDGRSILSLRTQLRGVITDAKQVQKAGKEAELVFTSLSQKEFRGLQGEFGILRKQLHEAGKEGNTFVGVLTNIFEKFGGWMLVTKAITFAIRQVRKMIENVVELDTAMTELRKVTTETEASYDRFLRNAATRAKTLGATLTDTVSATADFARLGHSMQDAAVLADAAIIYKNVGDGIEDINQASESIISTMQAFGFEAENVMSIVDKFNIVGNEFAISSTGIGEALLNSASALAAAGNSLDESIALITAANEVIQNPEKVGTAMKTLSMYIRAAKTEAEEAGIETDGMANSVSELRKEILDLTGQKVDIMIDGNTFKSTVEVLRELSAVWDDLTDTTRANITELIGGGVRNANVIAALINNFATVEEVLATSANSAGSAMAENEKYLESIAGKISQFEASYESLGNTLISSDLIAGTVDAGTELVTMLDGLIDRFGAFPSLISAAAGALTANLGLRNKSQLGLFEYDAESGFSTRPVEWVRSIKQSRAYWEEAGQAIEKYNSLLGGSVESQNEFLRATFKTDKELTRYLNTLNDSNASLKGYRQYCKDAGVQAKGMGNSSKFAALGVTLLNTAVNMLLSFGLAIAVQAIVTKFNEWANAAELAAEKGEELNAAYAAFKETNENNIQTLEGMREEFETLSDGVSQTGENIALSADEYARYQEIVQTIIDISPQLAEAYNIENGYLADKNELLEEAIRLQEEERQQRLLEMSTNEALATGMSEYTLAYQEAQDEMNAARLSLQQSFGALFGLTNVTLDDAGHNSKRSITGEILGLLGVEDIEAELDRFTNDYGGFQYGEFWKAYGDAIVENASYIISSFKNLPGVDLSALGYADTFAFEAAGTEFLDYLQEYRNYTDDLAEENRNVQNQLSLIAQSNEDYMAMSGDMRNLVDQYIQNFGVEDIGAYDFLGDLVPDQDKINEVKTLINNFIAGITPELEGMYERLFALGRNYTAGDIGATEFLKDYQSLIEKLQAAGASEDTIVSLRVALNVDAVEEQLDAVRKAIGGLSGEYDEALGDLSSKELALAYRIVSSEGSMSFDDLLLKIQEAESAWNDIDWSATVNVRDFSELEDSLAGVADKFASISSAMDKLREGTALTSHELMKLAMEYPQLLEVSNLFTDGTVEGQRKALDSILSAYESEHDAYIDTKIAELEAANEFIKLQIELENEKKNKVVEIANLQSNGQLETQEQYNEYLNDLRDLEGRNYVTYSDGVLSVNQDMLEKELAQTGDSITSMVPLFEAKGQMMVDGTWQGAQGALQAYPQYAAGVAQWYQQQFLPQVLQPISQSIADALNPTVTVDRARAFDPTTGELVTTNIGKTMDAYGNRTYNDRGQALHIGSTGLSASWQGMIQSAGTNVRLQSNMFSALEQQYRINGLRINDWAVQYENTIQQRVQVLTEQIAANDIIIENLKALKGLDLNALYGSSGGGSSGGSSSSGSDVKTDTNGDGIIDAEDTLKEVEEYIADIDAYYAAQKKLEELQARRESLEKKLEHSSDPSEKIDLSSQLIEAYREEAQAERDLMHMKQQTIMANVGTLRALGFQVEYNSAANELYIANLDHLNELTASSAGKYDTLQEATNELRKETETLIDVTEQLNADNIEAIANIEDLSYAVLDAKNNIIDYVQEIYDKQVEAYQKIIDLRKELIESAKEEYDYEADIADKVEEIAKLQARIDQLSLDDSRSAQVERNSLMEELAALQEELARTQNDHAAQEQLDALDKMAEDFAAEKENEIEIMRNSVAASEEIWTAFYQTILGQNVNIGESIDNQIAGAWIRAAQAVRQYSASVGNTMGTAIVQPVPKYHSGGVVEEANLNKEEALAILQKGEVVLNAQKQEGLYKIIDFQEELSKRLGISIGNTALMGMSSVASTLQNPLRRYDGIAQQSMNFAPHIEVTIHNNGGTTATDANAFGSKIADVAIEKLYGAFERRGISAMRTARLRP